MAGLYRDVCQPLTPPSHMQGRRLGNRLTVIIVHSMYYLEKGMGSDTVKIRVESDTGLISNQTGAS